MNFTPKWFYIFSTPKYFYVGQTHKKDLSKYHGSGNKWQNHLKKHGFTRKIEMAVWCETAKAFQECLDLYVPKDYVESPKWANAKAETPWDDSTGMIGLKHSLSTCSLLSRIGKVTNNFGKLNKRLNVDKEHQSVAGKRGGAATAKIRVTCECGLSSSPGSMGGHFKATGHKKK